MAEPRSFSSCERLESEENLAFQERSWRGESVGRWLVFLLVAAAAAGIFGRGPLSHAEAATPDGRLRVEYPRFARTDSTYQILVYSAAGESAGTTGFWIGRSLLNVLQIEAITPEPETVELGQERVHFRFRLAPAEAASAPVTLHVKTHGAGRHTGPIGAREGEAVELRLWLYP